MEQFAAVEQFAQLADEIVPPGVDTCHVHGVWKPASPVDVHRRRRPLDQR